MFCTSKSDLLVILSFFLAAHTLILSIEIFGVTIINRAIWKCLEFSKWFFYYFFPLKITILKKYIPKKVFIPSDIYLARCVLHILINYLCPIKSYLKITGPPSPTLNNAVKYLSGVWAKNKLFVVASLGSTQHGNH